MHAGGLTRRLGPVLAPQGAVWACVLDTPALRCATGSADFTARIWDACGGTQLHEFQHNHIVRTCNFSYDTTKLVTGGGWVRTAAH